MKVAAQVYDYIFAAKINEKDDLALIRATREADNVYFGLALELHTPGQSLKKTPDPSKSREYMVQNSWLVSVPESIGELYVGENPLATYQELATVSRGLGSLSVKFDRDGVLRRVPLIVQFEKAFYPLLPLLVICEYLSVTPDKIMLKPGQHIILHDAKNPLSEIVHDIVIPIDSKGNMIVNYVGQWERMDHYNFADIMRASDDQDEIEIWTEELQGKIVIISDISTGSADIGPIPFDATYPLSGVHANVIHNILTGSFLKELSGWNIFLLDVLILIILVFLSFRSSYFFFSVGSIILSAAFITAALAYFLFGQIIVNILRPLMMIGIGTGSIIIYRYIKSEKEKLESLRQRNFIRHTFGRYLSNEVVDELLDSPEGLRMSGENREVTFLVSDLRGFTSFSSKLTPEEVIKLLNRYFESMVEVIAKYRGTVSELMGDGILSFFGAPLCRADDPERAVACAIEMQNALSELNVEYNQLNLPELAMGIGINTGEVVVGNIGSEKRASYGAVGTPINVAFRIESFSVGGQILISPSTFKKIQIPMKVNATEKVKFKGIYQPMCLYDVHGIGGHYQVSLQNKDRKPLKKLNPPLKIECFQVEGKTEIAEPIAGKIEYIGENVAEISLASQIEAYKNLKIVYSTGQQSRLSELYAKVVPEGKYSMKVSGKNLLIEFTSFADEIKNFMNELGDIDL
jgi:adenylate cyclase